MRTKLPLAHRKVDQISVPVTPGFKGRFLKVAGENPTSYARRAIEERVERDEKRASKAHAVAVAG